MTISYMEQQVIIVTCDAQFRAALQRVCSGGGGRIETTHCIETALEIADRCPVCLMVAEVSLQVAGDGLRLAKTMHKKNPDMKCFLVVDKDDIEVAKSTIDEPWLCFEYRPIRMLRFSVELIDVMKEPRG